ncbi:HEAT repeat domain-containing protein [Listeria ilorinensis]|uniref:HEAT repeat domain-containing protein n=1 Tax=Listeria ilorinensis TaxID=2867439 RepID=UPI001EF5529D|nr:HEAT repeat domain-containing protein [Listeria ilorinensis]
MDKLQIIQQAQQVTNGFKVIQNLARMLREETTTLETEKLALEFYQHPAYQVRTLAVFLMGSLAAQKPALLAYLKDTVSADEDWRVQEILAMAFDQYCKDSGYEKALPVIKTWLKDERPNVRRSVTEGLRIWTSRPYFSNHPETAISLLAGLHQDESNYVRKSVGNALRDISKKHPKLVIDEVLMWDKTDKHTQQVIKLITKNGLIIE